MARVGSAGKWRAKDKEADIAALHGTGPNALGKLKDTLKAAGKSFAKAD
jgi:hypothetical protein